MAKSVKSLSLLFAASLLLACGERAEVVELGPVTMPVGHEVQASPEPQPEGPRQVVIPEALQGKYAMAMLALQMPGMAGATDIELPLNGVAQETGYGTLLVRDYLPAFMISGNTITTEGGEEKNPAVWAEWQRDGQILFSGWLFRDYPGLNPLTLPEHTLTFSGVK